MKASHFLALFFRFQLSQGEKKKVIELVLNAFADGVFASAFPCLMHLDCLNPEHQA